MTSLRSDSVARPPGMINGGDTGAGRVAWGVWHGGPWLVAWCLVGAVLAAPAGWADAFGPWFFLSSVLVFGLSHGAADVWLARRLSACEGKTWSATRFVISYLAMMCLALVVWALAPLPAFALFLLLTAWHWGSAEVVPSRGRATGAAVVAQSMARGTWVILAPFAWHTDQVVALLASWGWWPGGAAEPAFWLGQGGWLALWWLAVAADLLATGAAGRGHSGDGSAGACRLEVCLLLPAAMLLPPLWWVGLYFMAFHAWRHGLRLALLKTLDSARGRRRAATDRGLGQEACRLLLLDHRGYWLAAALLLVPVGWWWHGRLGTGVLSWTGTYVMWLAALTVPHALLVRRLDHREAGSAIGGGGYDAS